MRILFLSAWCPLPADNGSKLRIWSVLKHLAKAHEIDLLSFAPALPDQGSLERLEATCRSVELIEADPFAGRLGPRLLGLLSSRPSSEVASRSPAMVTAVARRADQRFDLVIASQLQMAPYALLHPGRPRILEEIEIGRLRDQFQEERRPIRRLRFALTWWKARRALSTILERFDGATVPTEEERLLVEPLLPEGLPLRIVTNGVEARELAGLAFEPEADSLIYPGSLTFAPNFEAVRWFTDRILPSIRGARPCALLRVTGRVGPAQAAALGGSTGVELTGYLEDVRPAIARSWAEVVPLLRGGGSRLKILEALALGTPVVSTTKGSQGLRLEDGRHVLRADSADQFATVATRLLGDRDLRDRLSAAGRDLVSRHYDWKPIVDELNDLLEQVVSRRAARGG
jgi:glycosyltransferase involved in cell wall biosynthesis